MVFLASKQLYNEVYYLSHAEKSQDWYVIYETIGYLRNFKKYANNRVIGQIIWQLTYILSKHVVYKTKSATNLKQA